MIKVGDRVRVKHNMECCIPIMPGVAAGTKGFVLAIEFLVFASVLLDGGREQEFGIDDLETLSVLDEIVDSI
jgi:hypothetical protein